MCEEAAMPTASLILRRGWSLPPPSRLKVALQAMIALQRALQAQRDVDSLDGVKHIQGVDVGRRD